MTEQDMMLYGATALAFLVIGGIGLALTGDNTSSAARKRAKSIGAGDRGGNSRSRKGGDDTSARRKETQKMLAKLREQDEQRKKSLVPQDVKGKIEQAGLSISPATFWIISILVGLTLAFLAFISGAEGVVAWGYNLKSRPVVIAMAGLTGLFGVIILVDVVPMHTQLSCELLTFLSYNLNDFGDPVIFFIVFIIAAVLLTGSFYPHNDEVSGISINLG